MSQDQRLATLRGLAKSGDLRAAATARDCFYYVSDEGKNCLGEMLAAVAQVKELPAGVTVEPPRELPALARDFSVGNTPNFITYETLHFLCGNMPVSSVLNGHIEMIAQNAGGRSQSF